MALTPFRFTDQRPEVPVFGNLPRSQGSRRAARRACGRTLFLSDTGQHDKCLLAQGAHLLFYSCLQVTFVPGC